MKWASFQVWAGKCAASGCAAAESSRPQLVNTRLAPKAAANPNPRVTLAPAEVTAAGPDCDGARGLFGQG